VPPLRAIRCRRHSPMSSQATDAHHQLIDRIVEDNTHWLTSLLAIIRPEGAKHVSPDSRSLALGCHVTAPSGQRDVGSILR
jgi:hypothetical protein